MPEITRFLGVVIKMFFREHNPPCFYALYGEYLGEIDINTLTMIQGDLPPRVLALIIEWVELHQKELLAMWDSKKIQKLPPLV